MNVPEAQYDFDEEGSGFGEPETSQVEVPPMPMGQKLAAFGIGLGVLLFFLTAAGLVGLGTGWTPFLATFGLVSLSTAIYYYLDFKDTTPGIKHDATFFRGIQNRRLLGWSLGIAITGFYVVLYFYKELKGFGMPPVLDGAIRILDPLAQLTQGGSSSQWFLYGVLYTLSIIIFGARMLMKYRHNRYHQIRTWSVMFFQFGFAWFLPNLLVYFKQPYLEFNGVWPLKNDYLWPEKIAPGGAYNGAGLIGTFLMVWAVALFVGTPLLTYFFGKRWYCSWVCGCGGLAETLGDPWRQQSNKSTAAWKLERFSIHAVLILVVATTGSLWIDYSMNGALYGTWGSGVRNFYGFYIVSIFSGVVGVGFYPLLGNRVWCRFGCPQAAILGIWQRVFSRFRITTNGGQCMSCGNCSTYCEMGIDVRAYAQNSENIVRSSCVGCGVCSAVCPRGVLKLENGPFGDRFEGADEPLRALRESLQKPDIYGYTPWPAANETPSERSEEAKTE